MMPETNACGVRPVTPPRRRALLPAGAALTPGGNAAPSGVFLERWATVNDSAVGSSDRGAQMARKAWLPLLPAARGLLLTPRAAPPFA